MKRHDNFLNEMAELAGVPVVESVSEPLEEKKADKKVNATFYKYFDEIQIDLFSIPKVYKDIEKILADGDDVDGEMKKLVKKYAREDTDTDGQPLAERKMIMPLRSWEKKLAQDPRTDGKPKLAQQFKFWLNCFPDDGPPDKKAIDHFFSYWGKSLDEAIGGMDPDQERMFDEIVLMAVNEGRFYDKRDAKGAVAQAWKDYQRDKATAMREDFRAIERDAAKEVLAQWKAP